MKFGCNVFAIGPLATPESLTKLVRSGEELGFHIVRVGDHILIPKNIASRHPASAEPGFPAAKSGDWLDSLALLSFLAGQTSKIRLLISVIVLPLRAPVLTAKMLATIDVLSGGRLIVGCGVGWMREEFEALGVPPFDERGAVSDEYIRAFKELWTNDNPVFEGKFCRFSDISFLPKPVQRPHPPIWIGGNSPAAMRRAARHGDAWYPTSNDPEFPLGTPDQLGNSVARLRRYAEEAGRDPDEIGVVYGVGSHNDHEPEYTSDGQRRFFTGAPGQVAEDIDRVGQLGVRHVLLNFEAKTLSETLDRMEHFATTVIPLIQAT